MIINEDFFDSTELDNEVVSQKEEQSEDDYSQYKYLLTTRIPEEHIQDFSIEYFKKILNGFPAIDYAVEHFMYDRIIVYFNHSMKTLKQYLNLLLCLYNATLRKIDDWICELNEEDFSSELSLFADMSVIFKRYTNPVDLCYMDTIEAKMILREIVIILNDGLQIFSEDEYEYVFDIVLKSNAKRAEKEFENKFMSSVGKLVLNKNNLVMWTTNDNIQEMLTNSLNIDSDVNVKEVSVVECMFKKQSTDCDIIVVQIGLKPDFIKALTGFRHSDKLLSRKFFEIYPKYCPFYLNHKVGEYAVMIPVGQIREKDKQMVCMYYLKIMYSTSINYNNYMRFANFLLDKTLVH